MTNSYETIQAAMIATPSQENLKKIHNNKQQNIFKIKDIEWKQHSAGIGGERAIIQFNNGYQASIIRGGLFYTTGGTHEIAILDEDGSLDYTTGITDDVIGYLSTEEAEGCLVKISELEKK